MEWQRLLDAYPPSPADFLDPPPTLSEDCLTLLSRLFELAVTSRGSNFPPAPLSQLHCEGFGAEEVWEEVELLSQPITRYLQQCASGLQEKGTFRLLQDEEEEEEENRSPPGKDAEGAETANNSARLTEEEEEEEDELEKEDMLEEEEEEEEDEGKSDLFFNLSEMEEFVNQAEDSDNEEEEEDHDLFRGGGDGEGTDGAELHYSGFFDPPPPSTHSRKEKKMKQHIARLEARNLSDKPWQMMGETFAKMRPENSLLENDLAFESASRPAPEITEEVTQSLEDIIKQRIIDKAWDDVQRRHKPPERPYNYTLARPLDQEKSKLSLAEVYEKEYLQQSAEVKEEENPQHKEIKHLMQTLFLKLDALANYHFTPKMPEPEIKTIHNLPSLSLEEVTPGVQSEATLLAPEEVQSRAGHLATGSSERTLTDKKRERRKKRRHQQLRKLLQAKRTVQSSRKTVASDRTTAVKSSRQFFARLQERVQSQIQQKRRPTKTSSNDGRKHLKL